MSGLRRGLAVIAVGIASFACAGQASAAVRPFWLGMEEPLAIGATPDADLFISNRIKSAGVRYQRVSVSWRDLAPAAPVDQADTFSSGYDQTYLSSLDDVLRAAADQRPTTGAGLEPLLVIEDAPDWAQLPGRPHCNPLDPIDPNGEYCRYPGTWKPDPAAVSKVAQALAARYDGTVHNTYNRLLPKVTFFQAWNEPNLSTHLTPQSVNGKPVAADVYRGLLRAFRSGLTASGRAGLKLVSAGLAPFGKTAGVREAAAPQEFTRALLCLKLKGRQLVKVAGCAAATFDIWAQHPYDIQGSPKRPADRNHRHGLLGDLPAIRAMLDRATALKTVLPVARKQLWLTEFDWWTNPPNRFYGRAPALTAHWTTDSLYRAWLAGADSLFWFRMRDFRDPGNSAHQWPGGLWFASSNVLSPGLTTDVLALDAAKPGLANFRWPLRIATGKRPYAWGIVPCRLAGVGIRVERLLRGSWRSTATATSWPSGVFTAKLPAKGSGKGIWRAVVGTGCSPAAPVSPVWNTSE